MISRTAIATAVLLCALPLPARAQYARRDVPAGEVTGLEVGVDGALAVAPGGTLRWFVTVYEVVRSRDLRPSPGTRLQAFASFARTTPVAEATTDALGRAQLSFAVPATLEEGFNLALDATSPRGVTRRFDVQVGRMPRHTLTLVPSRAKLLAGEPFRVLGRVIDRATGRPDPGREVRLSLGGATRTLSTDARGAFDAALRAPRALGAFTVVANVDGASTSASAETISAPSVPSLVVRAAPNGTLFAPGANVDVDVVVRTPDGRPVGGAVLTGLSIPEPRPGDRTHPRILPTKAGPDGRARVPWHDVASTSDPTEQTGLVQATRVGFGTGQAEVVVRTSRLSSVLEWSVQGGAFAPSLPGRLFVRLIAADGSPRAGEAVTVEAPSGTIPAATTDADGVAIVEIPRVVTEPAGEDACSGPTVLRLEVSAGSHDETVCAPVDPDATVRITAPDATLATGPLPVTLTRAASVARAAVRVTALAREQDRWVPVAEALAAAGVSRVGLEIPREITGEVWIRARPLLAGGEPVRGGSLLVFRALAEGFGARVSVDGAATRLALSGAGDDRVTAFAVALPPVEGEALLSRLRATLDPVSAEIDAGTTPACVGGLLAARTPLDESAPAALRGGAIEPLPMPETPVEDGLLRDPWRTRARFVRGRLGRLLLALEQRVQQHLPDGIDEVAVHTARGWAWNTEVLSHVIADIGPEGATSLDGSELTIESLTALDPQITYDSAARRVTRRRLFQAIVHLAHFVRARGLDYGFARRGDPGQWLPSLQEEGYGDVEALPREELFDGWGRPMAIRAAPGGRARFRFLEPLPGWEVVSAGPDGRFGSADDVWDPFARILRSGSVYATAVGEDVLLARLRGVELDRAAIATLGQLFETEPSSWSGEPAASATVTWGDAPLPLQIDPHPLAVRAAPHADRADTASAEIGPAGGALPLSFPEEPRRTMVVAGVLGAGGRAAFDATTLETGSPMLVTAELPRRLHPGEELRLPVRLTWLGEHARTLDVAASGRGAVEARIEGETSLHANTGAPLSVTVVVEAVRTGRGEIRIAIGGNPPLRLLTSRVSVAPSGVLRARHDAAFVTGRASLEAEVPADAQPVRAALVVAAGAGVAADPGLEVARRRWPALFAWSAAMRGDPVPTAPAPPAGASTLSAACAVVALSARSADDPTAEPLRAAAVASLGRTDELATRLAMLVALSGAASGLAPTGNEPAPDPVSAMVERLREQAWATPYTSRDRPPLLARAAAGLLLADPRDAVGRLLVELASEELVDTPREGHALAEDPSGDDFIGTLALAIAARQMGDDALADALARGAAPRAHLAMRDDEESAFWLIAASLLGVLGSEPPPSVEVRLGRGAWQTVPLRDGLATLPMPAGVTSAEIRTRRPVLARVETRYARPVSTARDAQVHARIDGDLGQAGQAAALELVVTADAAVVRPVVEIALPPAASWDAATHASLAGSSSVLAVERPDRAGLVRLHLRPLGAREEIRLPLAVRWTAVGVAQGLALVAYDGVRPHRQSTTPARPLRIRPGRQERWP